jgi:hypothetical protein
MNDSNGGNNFFQSVGRVTRRSRSAIKKTGWRKSAAEKMNPQSAADTTIAFNPAPFLKLLHHQTDSKFDQTHHPARLNRHPLEDASLAAFVGLPMKPSDAVLPHREMASADGANYHRAMCLPVAYMFSSPLRRKRSSDRAHPHAQDQLRAGQKHMAVTSAATAVQLPGVSQLNRQKSRRGSSSTCVHAYRAVSTTS